MGEMGTHSAQKVNVPALLGMMQACRRIRGIAYKIKHNIQSSVLIFIERKF